MIHEKVAVETSVEGIAPPPKVTVNGEPLLAVTMVPSCHPPRTYDANPLFGPGTAI
jgi:hypothetical protein